MGATSSAITPSTRCSPTERRNRETDREPMALAAKTDLYARAVSDREEIAAFLRTDRRFAAYAFGDLDGPNRDRCSWGVAYDDRGRAVALAMHQEGIVPQPLFVMGEPAGCAEIVASVVRPREAYLLGTERLDEA